MLYVTFKGESTTLQRCALPPLAKGGFYSLYLTFQNEPYELYPKAVINLTFDAIKHNSMVYKKG